jgi:RNA polymerase sigma-70 factor, ECF subfamily
MFAVATPLAGLKPGSSGIVSIQEQNESKLIERVRKGEKNLFHDLIRPHERQVYLAAFALLGNAEEAEDAAQETMIKAFRNLATFRGDAKFGTWLVSIALNEARSRLRKSKRVQVESLDEVAELREGDFTPALLTDWREIPSEALERSELRTMLQSAVRELPAIYREIFTLRDLQELNVEETAELLGVTPNVVKVRLHRARMLLQKRLVPLLKSRFVSRRGLFRRALWS